MRLIFDAVLAAAERECVVLGNKLSLTIEWEVSWFWANREASESLHRHRELVTEDQPFLSLTVVELAAVRGNKL